MTIDGPSTLTDAEVGDGCHIHAYTSIEGAKLEGGAKAGPYARIRIGCVLERESYAGNFVEMKNARLGQNSLACHLTYLGEWEEGERGTGGFRGERGVEIL